MMQVSMKFITAMVDTCRVQLDESSCFCVSFQCTGNNQTMVALEIRHPVLCKFFHVQRVAVTDQGITLNIQTMVAPEIRHRGLCKSFHRSRNNTVFPGNQTRIVAESLSSSYQQIFSLKVKIERLCDVFRFFLIACSTRTKSAIFPVCDDSIPPLRS